MAHRTNINSFLAAGLSAYPLLSTYGQLAALELALKDHFSALDGQWRNGHDVPQFLADLENAGINSLSGQLHSLIRNIPCTDNRGNQSQVRADKYPDLRYARHSGDFSAPAVTDEQLQDLVDLTKQIVEAIRKLGVAI